MIRNNDPKLKQLQEDLFKDEDFEGEEESSSDLPASSKKKLTYKDTLVADAKGSSKQSKKS